MGDRYVMIFEPDLCIGCNACAVECRRYNALSESGHFRTRVEPTETGTFPNVVMMHVRHSWAHCDNAVCINSCPTGATFRAENGFVLITKDKCIGCGACVDECPLEARRLVQEGSEVKADKCTWCYSRVHEGKSPVCVSRCITGALKFGKTSDPVIQEILSRPGTEAYHPEFKTKPQLYHTPLRARRNDLPVIRSAMVPGVPTTSIDGARG
ncbi:MAG: 4Fe-4S binding protein [Deltaproteobacteria bacterium]|nr:4Fe-4S binding protein [Deltaproteobacteria bacterium]